jgi:membrane protein required for colicin V production
MNTLDIILLVAVGIGALFGLISGLVKQLSFGAGIFIGLLQATLFYPKASEWIREFTGWESLVCAILGFLAIFAATALVINLLGITLKWLLKAILLGWLDRVLGAIFSVVIAMCIVVMAVNISQGIAPDNKITGKTAQNESLLYEKVAEVTFLIIDEAKKVDIKID